MQQTTERNAIGETREEQIKAREAAQRTILASGGELDPEGNRLEEAYLAMTEAFAGLSCEGMLKTLACYVVDQAFHNSLTVSESFAGARSFSKLLSRMTYEYTHLKMQQIDVRALTHEQIKAELDGAIRSMQKDPTLGKPGDIESASAARLLADLL